MTARHLRWALLLELTLYAAWLAWQVRSGEVPWVALGWVLICFFGLRWLVVAASYVFTLFGSDRAPARLRCGPFGWLRMVVEEYLGLLRLFVLAQPFESRWLAPDRLPNPAALAGRPPLLLIHGYQCNRGFWFWLRPRLEQAGWTVATLSLEPVLRDIDELTGHVEHRIRELQQASDAAQVILVGHSMGGLVARAYLRRWGAGRVARVITLGSPHYGSRLAALAWGRNGRQMVIGNPWLRGLQDEALPVALTSIYSVHDNQVMPQRRCSELAGSRSVPIGGVSHLGMATSQRVLSALLSELEPQPGPVPT